MDEIDRYRYEQARVRITVLEAKLEKERTKTARLMIELDEKKQIIDNLSAELGRIKRRFSRN